MKKPLMFAVILAGVAASAGAQAPANERKLTIYGSDRCPANTLCVRAPESERYRIPKAIRENTDDGEDKWSGRGHDLVGGGVGASGIGSCTATGPGGGAGCWSQQMRQARAERKAKKQEDATPQD